VPKICYIDKRFGADALAIIERANAIVAEYAELGFSLTLRQLYYQFVARDVLPNRQQEYKRLGDIVNDARLAGLVDWNAIEDRTRFLRKLSAWESPAAIVAGCAGQFHMSRWYDQATAVEVWIEKDALVGVIEPVCDELDVPYFSCRGYTSQSEMWVGAQRFLRRAYNDQRTLVLHFGDHDPSGKDMSRDIEERIRLFMGHHQDLFDFKRIALNMDQVEAYHPPPNPAKLSDSRAAGYVAEFGDDSWELDALEPRVIAELVRGEVDAVRDMDRWEVVDENETVGRAVLAKIADHFHDVATFLAKRKGPK
jgi:hypothetical protein